MFGLFAWPSVSVKRGATFAIRRKVVKIEWEKTFSELLENVGKEYSEESVTKVAVCGNEQFMDPVHDVPLDGPVVLSGLWNECLVPFIWVPGVKLHPSCRRGWDNLSLEAPPTKGEVSQPDGCQERLDRQVLAFGQHV